MLELCHLLYRKTLPEIASALPLPPERVQLPFVLYEIYLNFASAVFISLESYFKDYAMRIRLYTSVISSFAPSNTGHASI